jgi:hypothetical protein
VLGKIPKNKVLSKIPKNNLEQLMPPLDGNMPNFVRFRRPSSEMRKKLRPATKHGPQIDIKFSYHLKY